MEPTSSSTIVASLLADEHRLRALARRLVADASAAEDVVQQAWQRAIAAPPAMGPGLGSWMRTVVRHLALNLRREEGRRARRERAVARPEALPSTAELVDRAQLRRALVGEVLHLDEPYRTAVMLRYFEERSPSAIAASQGVPIRTVETRLRRGLERLRERLDRRHGGSRGAWCAAFGTSFQLGEPLVAVAATGSGVPAGLAPALLMTSPLKLLALSSLFLGALLWLSYLGVTGELLPSSREPLAEPIAAASPEVLSIPEAPRAEPAVARAEAETPAIPEPSLAPAVGSLRHVVGRLEFVPMEDAPPGGSQGQLELQLWRSDGPAEDVWSTRTASGRVLVPVEDEAFSFEVERGLAVELRWVSFDGVAYLPVSENRPHDTASGSIAIEVYRVRELSLEVLDEFSGENLRSVTVIAERPQAAAAFFGPEAGVRAAYPGLGGPGQVLASEANSPVLLSTADLDAIPRGERVVHVGAPLYAWKRAVLDFEAGGKHEIRLRPGAGLDLRFEGELPPAQAMVRIWRGSLEQGPDLEARAEGLERLAVEGLLAGPHRVRVEIGDWTDQPLVLAEAEFTAQPAERTELVLQLASAELPRPAVLSGSLVLAPFWRERNESLRIERVGFRGSFSSEARELRIEEMEQVREDLYLWDAGEVPTGRYELLLPNPRFSTLIEVGPGGVRDALLTVPPPGRLEVELRDAESGELLDAQQLLWRTIWPEGSRAGAYEEVARNAEEGSFTLVAPIGPIELFTMAGGLSWRERVEVRIEGGRHVLRVPRSYELYVLLVDGETLVPLPGGMAAVHLEPVVGAAPTTERVLFGDGRDLLRVAPAGRYRFELPQLAGYRPVPTQEVVLGGSEPILHWVRLVKD